MEYFDIILLIVLPILLLWFYGKKNYNYWTDRNVFCRKPFLPFMGNIKFSYLLKSNIELIKTLYETISGKPYGGIYFFTKPVIMVRDPELIKRILVTDFNYFVSRGFHTNEDKDPLAKNLIHINGKDWKFVRAKLQTAFTHNKLKNMVSRMDDLAKEVVKQIEIGNVKRLKSGTGNGNGNFDAVNVTERYMIDVICSSVFGVKSDAVRLNTKSEFYNVGKTIFDGYHFLIHAFMGFLFPEVHKFFNLTVARDKVTDFFTAVSKEAVSLRKKIDDSTNNEHKNFLDTLIRMESEKEQKKTAEENGHLLNGNAATNEQNPVSKSSHFECDEDFIAANVFMFFAAGYDSSAKICTFALFELAADLAIQQRARDEVINVLRAYDGNLTFEAVQKMTYLEQIVAETNRKYPILSVIFRKCDKRYTMPDGCVIEPGTPIIVPSSAIHFDPEYYPQPDKFDPERFSEQNKQSIHPSTHLAFGIGPRICVAWQFAIFEIKVVIARILSEFKINLHRTNDKYPLDLLPKAFLLTPKSDIYINFTKIN